MSNAGSRTSSCKRLRIAPSGASERATPDEIRLTLNDIVDSLGEDLEDMEVLAKQISILLGDRQAYPQVESKLGKMEAAIGSARKGYVLLACVRAQFEEDGGPQ